MPSAAHKKNAPDGPGRDPYGSSTSGVPLISAGIGRSSRRSMVDAMGQHAGSVCAKLSKAGHEAARLSGGIASWRGDNLPVVK